MCQLDNKVKKFVQQSYDPSIRNSPNPLGNKKYKHNVKMRHNLTIINNTYNSAGCMSLLKILE